MVCVPKVSYGWTCLGPEGIVTRVFLITDCDKLVARHLYWMTWFREPRTDPYGWRYRTNALNILHKHCHGSRFIRSNLALFEVIFLTCDLLRQVPAHVTCVEYELQNDHRWLNAVLSRGHIGLHGNFFWDHCWAKYDEWDRRKSVSGVQQRAAGEG